MRSQGGIEECLGFWRRGKVMQTRIPVFNLSQLALARSTEAATPSSYPSCGCAGAMHAGSVLAIRDNFLDHVV